MSTADPAPRPWTMEDRRRAPLPNLRIVGADGTPVASIEGVHMRDHLSPHRWTYAEADVADAKTYGAVIAALEQERIASK